MDTKTLYSKIQNLNKRGIVTMDILFEGHGYSGINKITESVQELRSLGLITIKSIKNRGRFETELIPKDGYICHEPKKESKEVKKFRERESNEQLDNSEEETESKPDRKEKAIIHVRRKL